MSVITGVKSNLGLYHGTWKRFQSAVGEKAKGDDFRMIIEGFPDLEFHVQATQIPEMTREIIEEQHGPHGVFFHQAGRPKNAPQVPITFMENIKGDAYRAIREWVTKKQYLRVELGLMSESLPDAPPSLVWVLEDTILMIEGVDLNVDDQEIIKPAGTLYANWISPFTPDTTESMSWN